MNIFRWLIVVILVGALAATGWWFFLRQLAQRQPINQSTNQLIPDDGRFRWGIQIRPFAMDRYTDALMDQQLDLARELGVGWVRLDWHNYKDFSWHDRIVAESNKRGLHVVLILEDIGVPTGNPDSPEKAKIRAQGIADHFKGRVHYYQLFNEVSGSALHGPEFPGSNFSRDYDQAKYRVIRDWMKGATAGIKAADPGGKTIVSAQWTHTGFIEQLIKDGVPFDILGWNWFSDMPNDLNGVTIDEHTGTSLLLKLKGFGKELWLTELGHRPGPTGQDEVKQAAYVKQMTERIHGYVSFKGLFYFELMDQSNVKAKGNKPEYYGMVNFAKDREGNWIIGSKKQAFDAYKQAISKLSK